MCIGFFFFFFDKKSKKNSLKIIIIFLAIILTLARAYILLIFLLVISSIVFKFLYDKKNKVLNILFLSFIIVNAIIFIPVALKMLGDKTLSDNIRVDQILQVFEMINPISIFLGHGLGIGVPIRPGHMEIMYLEIFHKQGLLGLVFWFSILAYIILKYYNYNVYCKKKRLQRLIDLRPFLFGVLFLYLQSIFNPYLTNSMGMTFLFIALIIFEKSKSFNEQKNISLRSNI
jgi:hypothetical protein